MTASEMHPGYYIRKNVLPKGMSVTNAAKQLGIGRPALSNLLNGNAALSPDMAVRLEKAFGVSARELMDMQVAFDAALAAESDAAESTRPYVPVFLQVKANSIENWADINISARHRLSVLLRTLVHSTGSQIIAADFPGNDDSERPGWDGYVEASNATPWVPVGKSGWEFGVNIHTKEKADSDYDKSIKAISSAKERKDITFIFVTPRRWAAKNKWVATQKAKKEWKDIRVYDASDLEQWLEQSIPGQTWFANEHGMPSEGLLSLDTCWKIWLADCKPAINEALFAEAVNLKKQALITKLTNPSSEPITIIADSRDEALAFLHCVFTMEFTGKRDQVVVFTEPGSLTKLISKSVNFIPVVTTRAVEKEFAVCSGKMPCIIIYPRNTANVDADIVLEPLSCHAFEKALQQMGCSRDDIQRWSRESGRSLTILRRRLSELAAIRTPNWAGEAKHATNLIPFLFAGAWKTNNETDKTIITLLAHNTAYHTLEENFSKLLQLEDSPVWSVGSFHGLVSKMDALFAVSNSITRSNIENFFQVAELVLSEGDPSLELAEEKRYMAAIYGKVRDISAALRNGICETLVLLSVYGNDLFRMRLGIDTAECARKVVHSLLTPVTVNLLESHTSDLPMYAEASPEEFLDIIEADLESSDPECLKLLRPVDARLFGRCYRTGLLWALENIAWSPDHLIRAVAILGKLTECRIEDNWTNKPGASLGAIFLSRMPQTAAKIEKRIAAMKHLASKHPQVAWGICVGQFNGHSTVGNYSHKPRWRPDAHGFGEPITAQEGQQFAEWAFEFALNWENHTYKTVGDLIKCTLRLPPLYQLKIWDLVDKWSEDASDEDRACLREKIRISVKMQYTPPKEEHPIFQDNACIERACAVYEKLKPKSLLFQHAWLFSNGWVEHSADEIWSEKMDFEGREKRHTDMRINALRDIISEYGIDGVLKLAQMGQAARVIGFLLNKIFTDEKDQLNAFTKLIDSQPSQNPVFWQALISGFFDSVPENRFQQIIAKITVKRSSSDITSLLLLTPFQRKTWEFVNTLDKEIFAAYWKDVVPSLGTYSDEDLQLGIDFLMQADRPRAAFRFMEFKLATIPPKTLFRIMKAIPTGNSEKADSYQMQSYYITQAFQLLHQSGEISVSEMSALEFQYLDVLDQAQYATPNLEKQIEENPDLFVHAISISYRRDDNIEDSVLLGAADTEQRRKWAMAAANLLEKFKGIPGRDKQGNIDTKRLFLWINDVRIKCKDLARSEIGDFCIGKMLSKAPKGKDGVWPCEPVRDVLEEIANKLIAEGITNGLYNSRGVHMRALGSGGASERELAQKYAAWVEALDLTHPQVANILRDMVRTYEAQAIQEDTSAGIQERLG